MDAGSHDQLIANDVRVVLLCNDCSVQPASPATLKLSLDGPANTTASFQVRIPFDVNRSIPALFALVDPRHIRHMEIESSSDGTVPEPVRQSLIAKGTSHGVISLKLQLDQSPTIIGPAGISRLYSANERAGNLLACLRVVSTARALTVFIAQDDVQIEQLSALCNHVRDSTLRANPRDYALDNLYGHQGGKDIGELLAPFTLRSSAGPSAPPPAYGQVQPDESSSATPEPCSATPPPTSNPRSAAKSKSRPTPAVPPSPFTPARTSIQLQLSRPIAQEIPCRRISSVFHR